MPLPEVEKTFSLEDVGAPEFHITFCRIPGMTYDEMIKFRKEQENTDNPDTLLKIQLKFLIKEWNLVDAEGIAIPIPRKNKDILGVFPMSFVEYIHGVIMKDSVDGRAVEFPLVNENETNSQHSTPQPVQAVEQVG